MMGGCGSLWGRSLSADTAHGVSGEVAQIRGFAGTAGSGLDEAVYLFVPDFAG